MCRRLAAALLLAAVSTAARGSSYLLYLEGQAVAGYSSRAERPIFYSMTQEEIMQKPSVGFDYLGRLSGETGDLATLALQLRLAWNEEGDERWEGQVYNAYAKVKTRWTDVWVGHNRPALGISSYFDSHGLLLRTLAMQGFGFDRDWGGGTYRDFSWGNLATSLCLGTGAPIYDRGNGWGAARVSWGVLARDNVNVGVSAGYGEVLETMGNRLLDGEPKDLALAGLDATYLRDALEHRLDVLAGTLWDEDALGASYRLGFVLDGEGRWKLEAQPSLVELGDERRFQLSLCGSHLVTADLTARLAYVYDEQERDHRVLGQLYWYHLL